MSNQPKSSKTYNLAIQYSHYSNTENVKKNYFSSMGSPNSYRLPKIIDVDQDDKTSRKKSPFNNIFNTQKQQNIRINELTNDKSFNIVGKKQVESYQKKLTKKKNIFQKKNQSALSLSRYSSSVKSQNENSLYLNKQEVLSFIRPSHNNTQNQSKLARDEQLRTIGSYKSSNPNSINEMSTLRKCKDKLMNYTKTWDLQKQKKTKFPSILDRISKYRSKVQFLQTNTLNQKRKFIKDNIWMETLRTSKNAENYYNDKFVQKIIKDYDKFSLKGRDKLQKQTQWIDQKDRSGYTFAFTDSLNIKTSGKMNRDEKTMSKQNNLAESAMNRTILKDSSPKDKAKQSEDKSNSLFNMSIGNLRSALANNRVQCLKKSKQSKMMSPPVLSQFSSARESMTSSLKPEPFARCKQTNPRGKDQLSRLEQSKKDNKMHKLR